MITRTKTRLPDLLLASCLCFAAACDDHDHEHDDDHDHENEVITTVTLLFTPSGGGTAITATFDDPDGDGGEAPTVDDIELAEGDYAMTVAFENGLESPPEDITAEVMDEADEHQVFFTGSAVDGPASDQPGAPLVHAYDDMDAEGAPIGLANTIAATAGSGTLTVTLRHLPPVGGVPAKTPDLAAEVKSGGLGSIGGDNDVHVDFDVAIE